MERSNYHFDDNQMDKTQIFEEALSPASKKLGKYLKGIILLLQYK